MRSLFFCLVCISFYSLADETTQKIFASLTGTWDGELYYLDYQSGRRFAIPMQIEAELTPDEATLINKLTYTDPGVLVHAVNLTTVDKDTGELVESYFREGKGELSRYQITKAEYNSTEQWLLMYRQQGEDDNRPALIQHTLTRAQDKLTSRKEVRFTDQPSKFILRNGTELKMVK